MRKKMKITGSQLWADDCGWSNTSHRKHFRSLFVAAIVSGRALSWKRTVPEDNIRRRLFWIKESNYTTHSHLSRNSIVLDMFTGSLHAQNWQLQCLAMDILETLRKSSSDSLIIYSLLIALKDTGLLNIMPYDAINKCWLEEWKLLSLLGRSYFGNDKIICILFRRRYVETFQLILATMELFIAPLFCWMTLDLYCCLSRS